MAELSPAAIRGGIFVAGLLLYGLLWYGTRGLPRFAKVLARLLPLGLIVPAVLFFSVHTPVRRGPPQQAPATKPIEQGHHPRPGNSVRLA